MPVMLIVFCTFGRVKLLISGYYSYINFSSTYQRLFYLPSEECHNKGLDFIEEITNLLKNRTSDMMEKHSRITEIYVKKCSETSTLEYLSSQDVTLTAIINMTSLTPPTQGRKENNALGQESHKVLTGFN